MSHDLTTLRGSLEKRGFHSLTDFFLAHPHMTIWKVAEKLSQGGHEYAASDIECLLRQECAARADFQFFARVTLFTALENAGKGWTDQHYLAGGFWSGMIGESIQGSALRAWRYLETLNLPFGWLPEGIFDPVIEQTVDKLLQKQTDGDAD
jgi:hypothetical protein